MRTGPVSTSACLQPTVYRRREQGLPGSLQIGGGMSHEVYLLPRLHVGEGAGSAFRPFCKQLRE